MVGFITMTVMLAGSSLAQAAVGNYTGTYAPIGRASTAQLNADARILALRLDRLDASFVHVRASHGAIILSSAGRPISASLFDEVGLTGRLYFRPVLCYAYPRQAPSSDTIPTLPGTGSVPTCTPASRLTEANLQVTPDTSAQGYSIDNVPPDRQFINEPSTSTNEPDYGNSTVLLPGFSPEDNGERYVLGPAEMSGRSISSAKATKDQTGAWVVDYTLAGSAGSELWDHVAKTNFHQVLGIELDGVVYSAPLIQPTQSSYSSFDGKGELSGDLTESEAQRLALAINVGALPVPLKPLQLRNAQP